MGSKRTSSEAEASWLQRYPALGDYKKLSFLGRGQSGDVVKVAYQQNMSAVKIVKLSDESRQEVDVLKRVAQRPHRNVLQLRKTRVDTEKREVFLFTEYCAGGSLEELLRDLAKDFKKPLSDRTAVGFLRQILSGLRYLHDNEVCHRDLKPANILLLYSLSDRRSLQDAVLKIADFGYSKIAPGRMAVTYAGTPAYMAPEVSQQERQQGTTYDTEKSDIWSSGMIFYHMLVGALPPDVSADFAALKFRDMRVGHEVCDGELFVSNARRWIVLVDNELVFFARPADAADGRRDTHDVRLPLRGGTVERGTTTLKEWPHALRITVPWREDISPSMLALCEPSAPGQPIVVVCSGRTEDQVKSWLPLVKKSALGTVEYYVSSARVPEPCKTVLRRMLDPNPATRASMAELYADGCLNMDEYEASIRDENEALRAAAEATPIAAVTAITATISEETFVPLVSPTEAAARAEAECKRLAAENSTLHDRIAEMEQQVAQLQQASSAPSPRSTAEEVTAVQRAADERIAALEAQLHAALAAAETTSLAASMLEEKLHAEMVAKDAELEETAKCLAMAKAMSDEHAATMAHFTEEQDKLAARAKELEAAGEESRSECVRLREQLEGARRDVEARAVAPGACAASATASPANGPAATDAAACLTGNLYPGALVVCHQTTDPRIHQVYTPLCGAPRAIFYCPTEPPPARAFVAKVVDEPTPLAAASVSDFLAAALTRSSTSPRDCHVVTRLDILDV